MEDKVWMYDIKGLADELEFDMEDMAGLFSRYISESKECASSMRNHLVDGDFNMLERVVHNIKGMSANLRIADVYSESAAFDVLLKSGKTDDAHMYVEKLTTMIYNSEVAIKEIFTEFGVEI